MGLGICLICKKEEFIYHFYPDWFKYLWFCENCSKKLHTKHYYLLRDLDLTFISEKRSPEYKHKFKKQRIMISETINKLINIG